MVYPPIYDYYGVPHYGRHKLTSLRPSGTDYESNCEEMWLMQKRQLNKIDKISSTMIELEETLLVNGDLKDENGHFYSKTLARIDHIRIILLELDLYSGFKLKKEDCITYGKIYQYDNPDLCDTVSPSITDEHKVEIDSGCSLPKVQYKKANSILKDLTAFEKTFEVNGKLTDEKGTYYREAASKVHEAIELLSDLLNKVTKE